MLERLTFNLSGKVRHEILEGREYLVAPMVMITEGVHHGSGGPYYYPAEELAKSASVWNHKPIVVYHPEVNGELVSACDPVILDSRKVGMVLNTSFDKKKRLRAEAWLEKSRISSVDDRITEFLEANQVMEVSTGLNIDVEETEGEFGGKSYEGIARNHKPDHLALLPDKAGACSTKDGAGLLVNHSTEDWLVYNSRYDAAKRKRLARSGQAMPDGSFPVVNAQDLKSAVALFDRAENKSRVKKHLIRRAEALSQTKLLPDEWKSKNVANELSLHSIARMVEQKLSEKYGEKGRRWEGYVEDVYESYVVFWWKSDLWKIGYKKENDAVELDGDAVKVMRVTEYQALRANESAGGETPEVSMTKKEKVDKLISNGWEEAERDWLMGLDEPKLDKMVANAQKPGDPPPDPKPTPTPNPNPNPPNPTSEPKPGRTEQVGNDGPKKIPSVQEFIANAPPEYRGPLTAMLTSHTEEKNRLVQKIVANKRNPFSQEFLMSKELPELKGMAALAEEPAPTQQQGTQGMFLPNFVGNNAPAGVVGNGAVEEEALEVPELSFAQ